MIEVLDNSSKELESGGDCGLTFWLEHCLSLRRSIKFVCVEFLATVFFSFISKTRKTIYIEIAVV